MVKLGTYTWSGRGARRLLHRDGTRWNCHGLWRLCATGSNHLVRFTQGMDGLLGVAGIITNDDGLDHSLIPYV